MVNGKLILNLTEPYIEAMILSDIAKKNSEWGLPK